MSLTRARFANGQFGVDIRSNPSDPWERHNFTRVYRRMRTSGWQRLTGTVIWIRPNDMYMNPDQTATLFISISSGNVRVNQIVFQQVSGRLTAVVRPPYNLNVNQFMSDIYLRRRAGGLRLAQRLSIAVAIFTGIAISAGFGPAAGAMGLSSGLTGVTSTLVSAVSSALATFIHQNYQAMVVAVNSSAGPGQFYRDRRYDFEAILINTLVSGASSAATSFIPGPSNGVNSLRDLVGLIGQRMANAFAGVAQNIISHMLTSNPVRLNIQQTRDQLVSSLIRDLVIRCLG